MKQRMLSALVALVTVAALVVGFGVVSTPKAAASGIGDCTNTHVVQRSSKYNAVGLNPMQSATVRVDLKIDSGDNTTVCAMRPVATFQAFIYGWDGNDVPQVLAICDSGTAPYNCTSRWSNSYHYVLAPNGTVTITGAWVARHGCNIFAEAFAPLNNGTVQAAYSYAACN